MAGPRRGGGVLQQVTIPIEVQMNGVPQLTFVAILVAGGPFQHQPDL